MHKSEKPYDDTFIEQFYASCKDCGIKVTHQRLEIYREVAVATDHPSAEDIHKRVKTRLPMISLDTIYRTLSLFEQCKIISRVHPLDDRSRFDPNTKSHHHFICLQCKKVEDFYWPHFDSLHTPEEVNACGVIKYKAVEIRGICSECLKKTNHPSNS